MTMDAAGNLQDIVAIAGALIGVATAVSLAWMRRVRWMPPEEAVAGATVKVSALICAVLIAVLYIFRDVLGVVLVSMLALLTLVVTLFALVTSIRTNTQYSFVRRSPGAKGIAESRILGGHSLTEEAESIAREKRMGHQQLYENSNYTADLVWTRASLADVQVKSTLGFISLQVSGSVALAAISMAFAFAIAPTAGSLPEHENVQQQPEH